MDRDNVKGKFHQLKGMVRERWGKLTDDEVDRSEGKLEQLAGRIQELYGTSKEEARRQLRELESRL